MDKSRTVCFSGKRPQNLPFGFDEHHPDCIRIKAKLKDEIWRSIRKGCSHFIGGMAMGADTWAAETVIDLMKTYPYITLEAAIPYMGQTRGWSRADQIRYGNILEQCSKKTILCDGYSTDCYYRRNRYMVEQSALLIAVDDTTGRGGTAYTINYAKQQGILVRLIPIDWDQKPDPNLFQVELI